MFLWPPPHTLNIFYAWRRVCLIQLKRSVTVLFPLFARFGRAGFISKKSPGDQTNTGERGRVSKCDVSIVKIDFSYLSVISSRDRYKMRRHRGRCAPSGKWDPQHAHQIRPRRHLDAFINLESNNFESMSCENWMKDGLEYSEITPLHCHRIFTWKSFTGTSNLDNLFFNFL